MPVCRYLLIILLLSGAGAVCLQAALRPEIQAIEDYYAQGRADSSNAVLQRAQPLNDEETAIILYYKAMLNPDAEIAKTQFQSLSDVYTKLHWGQQALLELGQLYLLDRNYDKALVYINRITAPDIDVKQYWLAAIYFSKGDFANTILAANQFIRLAPGNARAEEAAFLLADSYINLAQYNNAAVTLRKMLAQPDSVRDEQYLRYRLGYVSEMLNNIPEAISQYKQGYELNRYSQLAYQIEDRAFELRERCGLSVDLSFLYPYTGSALPDIVQAEQDALTNEENGTQQDSTRISPNQAPIQTEGNIASGIYLQGGRFSNQANAVHLCENILKLKLSAQYYKSTQYKDVSWVVIIGPFQTELDAVNAKTVLRENGIDSFIIQS